MKIDWQPGTMIYPLPAVLVSCGTPQEANLITVAWTGTICTNPAMCYISVRPERHSYEMIRRQMEFTINLTTEQMARATDWCGVRSGSKFDKWSESGLTPEPGVKVACPSVKESPLSIECRVRDIVPLGSHHMFIAEVLNLRAEQSLIDPDTGAFDLAAARLISYSHGGYFAQGGKIGHFGFSVRKSNSKNIK